MAKKSSTVTSAIKTPEQENIRFVNLQAGTKVPKSGKYKCGFCGTGGTAAYMLGEAHHLAQKQPDIKFFKVGEKFTECRNCGDVTGWNLIEEETPNNVQLSQPPKTLPNTDTEITSLHSQQTIEAEAESLDEARKQIKSQIPQGLSILSEKIISDGKPKTTKAIAETIEEAYTKAQDEIPNGADIVKKKELASPEQKVVTMEAFDEHSAGVQVKNESESTAIIKAIKLVKPGRKGFFGVGKKPNQYEVEVFHQAVIEITYKTKAKISTEIGDQIESLTALKDENKGVRRKAAETLKKIGDARAVEPLIAALKDSDREVRRSAANALGRIGDTRAVEPLIAAFKDEIAVFEEGMWELSVPGPAIVYALTEIGDTRAVAPLIAALKDPHGQVRGGVAEALGEIGGTQAVAPLIAALKDPDWKVRDHAATALGKLGDVRAVAPLRIALSVEIDPEARDAIGFALENLGAN